MLAVAAVALVAPADGRAAVTKFGSDLSAPADTAEPHGVDAVFWGLALPGGRQTVVPSGGQITTIRLKGTAVPSSAPGAPPPLTEVHFQVLHPGAGGAVTVSLTSQPFNVPSGGDPGQITSYRPIALCARAGDYVAFNDEGGYESTYYPQGVPYQVFSSVSGASTGFFTSGNGTNNGATFTGARHEGQELLMQMDLATGSDSPARCPGGAATAPLHGAAPLHGLGLPRQTARVRAGAARIRARCPSAAVRRCVGTLVLYSRDLISARRRTLGRAHVAILSGRAATLRVRLTRGAAKLVRRRRSLAAVARAVVRDGTGVRHRTRATIRLRQKR
jgi:hypothetical protein